MVLQEIHTLVNALNSLGHQFRVGWRNGSHHVEHISVVEHGSMNNATPGNLIESIA